MAAIAAVPNGPSYEEYFNAALESYKVSHDLLENWTAHPERFAYMATVDADAAGGYTISPLAEITEHWPRSEMRGRPSLVMRTWAGWMSW